VNLVSRKTRAYTWRKHGRKYEKLQLSCTLAYSQQFREFSNEKETNGYVIMDNFGKKLKEKQ